MKIAVTGASGFIGSELIDALKRKADIDILALTRNADILHNETSYCMWHTTDYSVDSLSTIFANDVDVVIHLAGVRGMEEDSEYFAINKKMTENILKAMGYSGVKRMVFASTMSVYSGDSPMPWNEDSLLGGRSAYGDSKIACEHLIQDYAGNSSYAIVRIAQVLGLGEKRRGMMNVFIDSAREHGVLKVMGKSIARKQYIYVKDLCEIFSMLAVGNNSVSKEDNVIVNAGMPHAYTSLEIAKMVNEAFGNQTPIEYDDSYPEKNIAFEMDIMRLKDEMGYEPMDMMTALRDIVDK